MFKAKSCLSIVWDKDYSVYGAVLSKRGKKFTLVDFASATDKNQVFPQKLSDVYKKLNGDNSERVIIGGYVPNALVFSVDVPNLKPSELKKFLDFEIGRYIPANFEDFAWMYRPVIYPGSDKNKITRLKVFAFYKSIYDIAIKDFIDSNIKYDAFLYPYFVIDPLYTAFDIYLESINTDFFSSASIEEEGWFMSQFPKDSEQGKAIIEETIFAFHRFEPVLKENLKFFIPAIINAEYALSPTFDLEKTHFLPVPPSCKPNRFKALKISAYLLCLVFLIVAGSYFIKEGWDNYGALKVLDQQLSSLKKEEQILKKKMAVEKTSDEYIQLVLSSEPNDINALEFLEYLSQITPNDIWANYLNTYGNSANLTMQTNSNSDKLIQELYRSTDYTLQNSRKNKSSDGSEYVYITLVKKEKDQGTEETSTY